MIKRVYLFIFILFFSAGGSAPAAENPGAVSPETDMVHIPAGTFIFGTNQVDEKGESLALGIPKPWYADETPEQTPILKGFYIDRYQVTNRRYQQYVQTVGAVPPQHWMNGTYPQGQDRYPVVWVTWFDAANFCSWAGKRLPTEREWEKTARGAKGRAYPWGEAFAANHANLPTQAGVATRLQSVGSFSQGATPLGVHDLVGNVWEWVNDDYAPYPDSTYSSPDYDGTRKVLRGLSASDLGHFPGESYRTVLQQFARAGYRQFAAPDDAAADVGFRCVSESKPKPLPALADSQATHLTPSEIEQTAVFQSFGGEVDATPQAKPKAAAGELFNPFQPQSNLPQSGILVLIFLSFIAGLFSFASPCTLPILPAYFAVTAQADRTRMTMMSFAFFCGLALVFILMGASASFFGNLLRDYLFSLTTIGGICVVIFGVMTLFGKGFSGATLKTKPASTFMGFGLFGAAFALGWTPCVGPVLSGILIIAASDKTIFQGMSLLFFYAVGLGMPLIIIAMFFSHLSKDGLFWRILRGKGWMVNVGGYSLMLHSTNLFSGLLLIGLGVILAMGYLTYFNSLLPLEMQLWFSEIEEAVVHWFK